MQLQERDSKKLRAGIIGYGYWGPNILRNIIEIEDYEPSIVVDSRDDRTHLAKRRYPSLKIEKELTTEVLSFLDVVFICTPATSHFALAKLALENQTNVWVEKPMTLNSKLATELNELAEQNNLKIVVDHTYVYSPAIERIKDIISEGGIGKPLYYESLRANLGIFQQDVSVIWDLAIHDLSILDFLYPDFEIDWISCRSFNPLNGATNSLSNITLSYSNGFVANISTNWLSPVKVRKVVFGGSTSSLVFDDTEPSDKVQIFAQEFVASGDLEQKIQGMTSYKLGSTSTPKLDQTEALRKGLSDFALHLLERDLKNDLRNSGNRAIKMIKILEAAEISALQMGKPIELSI